MLELSRKIVGLIGESLLMDTIEASLDAESDLSVLRLPADPAALDIWPALPDLIITDVNDLQQRTVYDYLQRFPETPMLGMDASSHRVISISCEPFSVRSSRDLADIVREKLELTAEPAVSSRLAYPVGLIDTV